MKDRVKSDSPNALNLQTPPDIEPTALSPDAPSRTDERSLGSIGPYRLLIRLGEGGMGTVWLAEQSAPVKREVAIKVIKSGHYSEHSMQRFDLERQSLAMMNHPAIAKVFDAGSTPEGQPYFVMEYVSGLPITTYCKQKHLSVRERIELMIKVCEGVQHAHQKAIVHRDLKPSNILITEVDGNPGPRIIDFGIAKAIETAGEEDVTMNAFTQAGGLVGTPGYMSPEQANPSIVDIDTRTDVYSLGVVLYELLTASLPFDPKQWKTKRFTKFCDSCKRRIHSVRARGSAPTPQVQPRTAEPNRRGWSASCVAILTGSLSRRWSTTASAAITHPASSLPICPATSATSP